MVKKSTIESIIREDMADMWALLNPDEKRIITDNFHIQIDSPSQTLFSYKSDSILENASDFRML